VISIPVVEEGVAALGIGPTASMMLLSVDEVVFRAAALLLAVEGSQPWGSGTGDRFHHRLSSRRRLVVTSLAASSSSEKTCFFFLF